MELVIVMPVYNEEGAIKKVLNDWSQLLSTNQIDGVICAYNDGSKDRSLEVMRTVADGNDFIKVIDKKNSGHGPTIRKGYVENANSKWIFQIDSDDEMGTDSFLDLWTRRNDYDFLICSRDGRNSPLARRIITFIARTIVSIFYNGKVYDVNSPYRLMKAEKFTSIYNSIPEDTFAPNVIISGFASSKNLKIYQSTARFKERETGVVSIQKWKLFKVAIKSFWQTLTFRFTNSKELV